MMIRKLTVPARVRPWLMASLLGSGMGAATLDALAQAPGAAPAAAAPAGVAPAATKESRLAVLRKKTLRDEDFIEAENNRDPFRSYITLFVDKRPTMVKTVPAIFDKFALEELTLIAIVSGNESPLAMFRDPGGLGQVLRRGDYLSKSAARISKILTDRVILEMTEVMATGEQRAIEKAVLVNPEGAQP